jgi:hypoxanthine phosphoribosyltransferase
VKLLLTQEQIRQGVARLAREVSARYAGRPLTIVGVLTGSIVLLADLIRELDLPLRVGVVHASSYRGPSTRRGLLLVHSEILPDIAGRDVLLVDDIFDTGHTLAEVLSRMDEMSPRSLRSAVLLRKQGRQEVKLQPDFVAFDIPNEFVVGYGLDYHDAYRNLPYLAALEANELEDRSLEDGYPDARHRNDARNERPRHY